MVQHWEGGYLVLGNLKNHGVKLLELDVGSLELVSHRTVSKKHSVVLSCFLELHPFFSLLSTI